MEVFWWRYYWTGSKYRLSPFYILKVRQKLQKISTSHGTVKGLFSLKKFKENRFENLKFTFENLKFQRKREKKDSTRWFYHEALKDTGASKRVTVNTAKSEAFKGIAITHLITSVKFLCPWSIPVITGIRLIFVSNLIHLFPHSSEKPCCLE